MQLLRSYEAAHVIADILRKAEDNEAVKDVYVEELPCECCCAIVFKLMFDGEWVEFHIIDDNIQQERVDD